MRTLEVNIDGLLDLVSAARDYGYADEVLMETLHEWAAPVKDEEISEFARKIADEDGYTEKDYEIIKERLEDWRDRYA